ncbi:MAG: HDOD domain-containing protein [Sedimenticola sp.]
MSREVGRPDLEVLQRFVPLRDLSENQLVLLAQHLFMEEADEGDVLIEIGSEDESSFYLVDGRVRLLAGDGRSVNIKGGTDHASHPISQLIPRRFQVSALSGVIFLRIDNQVIKNITPKLSMCSYLRGYEVAEDDQDEIEAGVKGEFAHYLLTQLKEDKLVLPSPPEMAVRIGRAIEDDVADAESISRIIQSDPAISAKIVKAANSALYGTMAPVGSCVAAVKRLGMRTTHSLVLTYTLRDIFKTDSVLLQQRMEALWKHSIRTAALCHVMARRDVRFNIEMAMLIGLLHDIGLMAIIQCAAKHEELIDKPEALEYAIEHFRGPIGSKIVRTWHFPHEFEVAAMEAESWMRDIGGEADYCDLVIVAQLHSYIGTPMAFKVPPLNEVPALARLGLGELTPFASLNLLEAADDETKETEALLSG